MDGTAPVSTFRPIPPAAAAALLALFAAAAPAPAQDVQRIAAIVNEDVISMYDLDLRTRVVLITSGQTDTPENRKRLQTQVLRGLIDEKLQKQEATKQSIKVTEADIQRSVADIERQNNMPKGGIEEFLERNGLPRKAMQPQVEASLAWQKLVQRKLKPRVEVGQDEIEEALRRFEANKNLPEMRVAEIFLAVDSPDQEDEVLRTMDRLIDQLQRGARFPALARQFSQSASAAAGGDLGFIKEGQLDQTLDSVLRQMPPGTLSKPVRSLGGYHLLLLIDRRSPDGGEGVKLTLQQVVMPLRSPGDAANAAAKLSAIIRAATSCAALDAAAGQVPEARSIDVGQVKLGELPQGLREKVAHLRPGQATEPVELDRNTMTALMVCARDDGEFGRPPSQDDIRERISGERLDLLSRRYLRDLRRAAFVDVRV